MWDIGKQHIVRQNAASDQSAFANRMLYQNLNKKRKITTQQPLKRNWISPIYKSGKLYSKLLGYYYLNYNVLTEKNTSSPCSMVSSIKKSLIN